VFRRAGALAAATIGLFSSPRRCSINRRTAQQAEIDAACEAIDFYRINPAFMESIYARSLELAGRMNA